MAIRMKRSCRYNRCYILTNDKSGYCDKHKAQEVQQYNKQRGSASSRGYDNKWRKYRIGYLNANPLCVECEHNKKLTPASVVDHIKPHKGDMILFWDINNHQALCKPCHDRKTATEDGGFGNYR